MKYLNQVSNMKSKYELYSCGVSPPIHLKVLSHKKNHSIGIPK
jgi:hypothetical protein